MGRGRESFKIFELERNIRKGKSKEDASDENKQSCVGER